MFPLFSAEDYHIFISCLCKQRAEVLHFETVEEHPNLKGQKILNLQNKQR